MRRTILFVVVAMLAAVALAAPASAGAPAAVHFRYEFTMENTYGVDPAGTLCDFDREGWAVGWMTVTEVHHNGLYVLNLHYTGYHRNADTGYTLSERDSFSVIGIPVVNPVNGTIELNVGLQWNLRDADGNRVTLEAGQVRLDFATDPPTWTYTGLMTANTYDIPGTAALTCPALGGEPDYPGMI